MVPNNPDDPIIETRGLAKHFGDVRAVDGIDLTIGRGEIYGFLGRNGAGKTTTIRMLLGLIRPTAGQVAILGTPIQPGQQSIFARVGFLVETATAYPNLTVTENLDIQRRLTSAPGGAVAEIITQLGLGQYQDRRAGTLSLGNKQRLSLARAMIHKPDLLILDEPANGLDPAGIVEIRLLLRHLADDNGVTVFVSSHILPEVANLVDRIGIVHAGKLVEEMPIADLHAKSRSFLEIVVSDPDRAAALLGDRLGMETIERHPNGALRLFDGLDRTPEIAKVLVDAGLDLSRLATDEEDLEAYFLKLTEGAY